MDRTKFNDYISQYEGQLIIEPEYLAASSFIDLNIDQTRLIPYIIEAKRLKLEPLIGSALTRKLMITDLTFEYDLLKDRFLNYTLLHWALAEYLLVAPFSVSQGGVYKHQATDSENASSHDVATLVQHENYKADMFARRLIEFLNINESYYPEYSESVGDGLDATKTAKFTGGLLVETSVACEAGGVGALQPSIFSASTYYGNTTGSTKPFDYTTLSTSASTVPNNILVQPTSNYFWLVSSVELFLAQVGTDIPMVAWDDPDVNGAIFVKGLENDLWWIRVKIAETYEQAVQFDVHI
jgi:hypothetical protein